MTSKAPYIFPPIGLAYIAGFIRDVCDCEIIDGQVDKRCDLIDYIKSKNFDIILINSGMSTIQSELKIAETLKSVNNKIVFLGAFACFFYKKIMEKRYIDFIINGEPESIIKNLIFTLRDNRNLNSVKGLVWKDYRNNTIKNKPEKLIQDLDSMPFAAVDLLNEKYYNIFSKKRSIPIITSRGCKFNCNFCSANFFSKGNYRSKSINKVIEEIDFLINKGYKDFYIMDDTFTINNKKIIKFCKSIKNKRIFWSCESRVDTINEGVIKNMKEAGCYQIRFGMESASKKILKKMNKKITPSDSVKVIKLCRRYNIDTVAYFILGYPGESLDEIEETIRFVKSNNPDFASFNLFTPIPGTKISNSLGEEIDWSELDFKTKSFCRLSDEELQRILKKAYKDFYLNLKYPIRQLFRNNKISDKLRFIKQCLFFLIRKEGWLWSFISTSNH